MGGLSNIDHRIKNKLEKAFTSPFTKKYVNEPPRRKDKGLIYCPQYKSIFPEIQNLCYTCVKGTLGLDYKQDHGVYSVKTDKGWMELKNPNNIESLRCCYQKRGRLDKNE